MPAVRPVGLRDVRSRQVAATGLSVSSGPLRGNSALKVDKALNQVGSIAISFTVLDSSNTSSMDFTSLASVSSGYPS